MNKNKIFQHRGALTAFALIAVAVMALAGLGGALSPVQDAKADSTHGFIGAVWMNSSDGYLGSSGGTQYATFIGSGTNAVVNQGVTVYWLIMAVRSYDSFVSSKAAASSTFTGTITITPPTGSPSSYTLTMDSNSEWSSYSGGLHQFELSYNIPGGYTFSSTGTYNIAIALNAVY